MKLMSLNIDQVRNLKNLQITPSPHINLITGINASGKTSILEAIYLLARGRSFRTPRTQDIIQHDKKKMTVTVKLNNEIDGVVFSGIEKEHGQQTIKYHGSKVKTTSEQARNIPIVLITQDSQTLITGGAKNRRHWLDWAMFHVEPEYLDIWKDYMKALRQRNALLKSQVKNRDLYRGWEQAMVESGEYLYRTRECFIEQLMGTASTRLSSVFEENVMLKQMRGWSDKKDLASALTDAWEMDVKTGYTRAGPHQADIKITNKNREIDAVFSRGQIKLFVCLLMLAQAQVFAQKTGKKPIILVDDFSAELDPIASKYLLDFLFEGEYQSFLTSATKTDRLEAGPFCQLFHVEQGVVCPMIN